MKTLLEQLVDAEIKALRRRARRKAQLRLDNMLWRRAKSQAMERALAGGPALPCDNRGELATGPRPDEASP